MEAQRELEILRVLVSEVLREKGVQFDQNFRRASSAEVRKLNERYGIQPPILLSEFAEVVIVRLRGLMHDHIHELENLLRAMQEEDHPSSSPA